MRKNFFKLALTLGAAMLFGFAGCTVEVNEPEPITPTSYAVGISEGIENGSVSADRQTAQKGQTVTLTLTANAGYNFGSVSVKDASNNSVEIATVTAGTKYMFSMPESNVTVSATFTATSYAVGISAGIENGSVSTNKQTAQKGETVTLTLAANAGYKFGSISVKDASNNSVDTTAVTAGTTYTFVMPESSVTVNASFTPRNYTVGISAGIENGSVIADRQTAQKGQTVTLTVSSNEDYGLGLISVKDASNNTIETRTVTTGTKYAFVMPESDVTVSASFTPKRYAVGILAGIENGSVRADKLTAKKNETVTLTLSANAGYKFGSISVKDASNNSVETRIVTTGTKYTFVMPASNVTVSATFVPRSYTVGISTGVVNGSVTTDKLTAQKGETVTLTLAANAGYQFGSISVKDASNNSVEIATVTAGTKYTFVMPESNVTVSASFTATSYAVSVSTGIENGSVSTDKLTAQKGQTVTLTLTANAGYKFGSISVKDASNNSVQTTAVTTGTKYAFIMPESDVTVSASFSPDTPIETSYTVLDSGTTGTMGTSGTYVLFGYWPQTIKADSVTVDETNSKLAGAYTYYKGSDGAWYAKIKENACQTGNKYSNGTDVAQSSANSYKYFKVEPIKWRVLTDNYSGKRLLLAESILVNHSYDSYSNNYANSEIRAYLNGTFWNTAFTDSEKSMIDETNVDNSAASTNPASNPNLFNGGTNDYACGTTKDKIFLLSQKEATTAGYGFAEYNVGKGDSNGTTESTRIRMTTDFAKASGAYQWTTAGSGGYWWLRSPDCSQSSTVYCVFLGGVASFRGSVYDAHGGVCPALSLKN